MLQKYLYSFRTITYNYKLQIRIMDTIMSTLYMYILVFIVLYVYYCSVLSEPSDMYE